MGVPLREKLRVVSSVPAFLEKAKKAFSKKSSTATTHAKIKSLRINKIINS
jgi:hypothetical protein